MHMERRFQFPVVGKVTPQIHKFHLAAFFLTIIRIYIDNNIDNNLAI